MPIIFMPAITMPSPDTNKVEIQFEYFAAGHSDFEEQQCRQQNVAVVVVAVGAWGYPAASQRRNGQSHAHF